MSVGQARRALALAHVVALVVDATEGLTKQDLSIAQRVRQGCSLWGSGVTPTARKLTKVVQRQVVEEGRSLLVVLNKMDECAHAEAVEAAVLRVLEDVAVDVRGVQLMPLSALTGEGVERLMPAVYPIPPLLVAAYAVTAPP